MAITRKEVAEAILALSYLEMIDLGDALASSVKSDQEETEFKFDPLNRDQWCELLRWWAEGHLDALSDLEAEQ